MKSDLDALMQARNLDAILVFGNAEHNPPMYYLTGGGHVAKAVLIKKRGEPAVLYVNAMEREEAEKSGLRVIPVRQNGMKELSQKPAQIFHEVGLSSGRVGVYGNANVSMTLHIVQRIKEEVPGVELVGEAEEDSLFMHAMEAKDESEVARIRKMGKITTQVVEKVREYLTSCRVREDEVLLREDGAPLTVGDVHSRIRLWTSELGAELPEGFIFSIGHDAGVPHSAGNPADLMRLGQTIVFDFYPAEAGGGYYYDFTRTWSLGYASPEAQKLYDEVKAVYDKVIENVDLNASFKEYQKLVCDEFNKNGHNTPMHTPGVVTEGYVHSIGHGLGLNLHERPFSRHSDSDDYLLKPGVVITIEPGLYYPEKGMGVRIEDTYWMRPDGQLEKLAEYPYDFVLPMKKWNIINSNTST
ncbi:MAG TPA: Xaa-Pro peptidase family protein [Anaerolineales bacterium]|nr:Xaa-Pro peptidase family protein [Anaerolineales bacterium]